MTFNKKKTIGAKVAVARLKRGLSQVEVARAVGISQPQLSKIENGLAEITLRQAFWLGFGLGFSVEELLK